MAVSGFRLRARLGFSIPASSLRPARHYPRLWIWRPSPGRQWDFNPPDLGAAQHTLRASPPPQAARPVPHGPPVGRPRPRPGASRVACASLVYVPSPLPRHSDQGPYSARSPGRSSFPRYGCRVSLCIVLFEACSAFTRVTARTLALPPIRGTLHRRLQPLRCLHDCSGCFRRERSPGGPLTHWEAPPLHGARQLRTYPPASNSGPLCIAALDRMPAMSGPGRSPGSKTLQNAQASGRLRVVQCFLVVLR